MSARDDPQRARFNALLRAGQGDDVDFTHYAQGGFSWADQERAAEWLALHPGPVVLLNQATPRIKSLYRALGYELRFLDAPRRINCTGDRTPAKEVLALRNL